METNKKKSFAGKIVPYFVGVLSCVGSYNLSHSSPKNTLKKINWVEEYNSKKFIDTEKPNAIFTIPKLDKSDAFSCKSSKNLVEKISSAYDVNFKILDNEKDLYSVINNTPNIELLVIGGHGEKGKIIFGSSKDSEGKILEESFLDSTDLEIKEYLANLDSNATIFLNSCESGKYGLVDNLKELSREDITIFGPKDLISPFQIKIDSLKPFRISFNGKVYPVGEGKYEITCEENSEVYMR